MSDAIRREFVMTYGDRLINGLTDELRPYRDYGGLLRAMREAFARGQFLQTLNAYTLITSDVLKFDESVLVLRLRGGDA